MSIQLQFENGRNVEAYRIAQARAEDARLSAFGDEQLGKQGIGSVIKSGAAESMAVNRDAQIAADEKNKKDAVETQVLLASLKEQLKQEMADIDARRTEINDMREGIEDVFANGYVLEDGRISNEQAEKALREYEERTDETVDRANEGRVYAALQDQWDAFDREDIKMNKRANEIDHLNEVVIPRTENILNDPTQSVETKQQAIQEVEAKVDNSSFDGKEMLDKQSVMKESGYVSEANVAMQGITTDKNTLMMGL